MEKSVDSTSIDKKISNFIDQLLELIDNLGPSLIDHSIINLIDKGVSKSIIEWLIRIIDALGPSLMTKRDPKAVINNNNNGIIPLCLCISQKLNQSMSHMLN